MTGYSLNITGFFPKYDCFSPEYDSFFFYMSVFVLNMTVFVLNMTDFFCKYACICLHCYSIFTELDPRPIQSIYSIVGCAMSCLTGRVSLVRLKNQLRESIHKCYEMEVVSEIVAKLQIKPK